jgi:hypothetical protein
MWGASKASISSSDIASETICNVFFKSTTCHCYARFDAVVRYYSDYDKCPQFLAVLSYEYGDISTAAKRAGVYTFESWSQKKRGVPVRRTR